MAKPTPRVLALQKQYFDQYKKNKNSWIKKYGADTEQVMAGAAFKRAESTSMKENKQRVKELIKKALMEEPEEINSKAFIQTREQEKNPIDIISMDVPLLIRLLEYAKEDAQTDMDLHKITENLIELSKQGRFLTMDDYQSIVSPDDAM